MQTVTRGRQYCQECKVELFEDGKTLLCTECNGTRSSYLTETGRRDQALARLTATHKRITRAVEDMQLRVAAGRSEGQSLPYYTAQRDLLGYILRG